MLIYYMIISGVLCGALWFCMFGPCMRARYPVEVWGGTLVAIMVGCFVMGYEFYGVVS
jgi:hypothetical protein